MKKLCIMMVGLALVTLAVLDIWVIIPVGPRCDPLGKDGVYVQGDRSIACGMVYVMGRVLQCCDVEDRRCGDNVFITFVFGIITLVLTGVGFAGLGVNCRASYMKEERRGLSEEEEVRE